MVDQGTSIRRHLVRRSATVLAAAALSGSIALAAGGGAVAQAAVSHISYANFMTSNWAGYIAQGSVGQFTSVTGSWVEPKVTCAGPHPKKDLFAPWIGIDGGGNGSETVEQTGVQAYCATGSPVYSAWYEMYPQNPVYYTNPVSANDVFDASVTESAGTFTLKLEDVTKGWTKTTTATTDGAVESTAEAVVESPTGYYPAFTSTNFSGIAFDGKALDTYSLVKTKALIGSSTGKETPSKITDGNDFSIVPKA